MTAELKSSNSSNDLVIPVFLVILKNFKLRSGWMLCFELSLLKERLKKLQEMF